MGAVFGSACGLGVLPFHPLLYKQNAADWRYFLILGFEYQCTGR